MFTLIGDLIILAIALAVLYNGLTESEVIK